MPITDKPREPLGCYEGSVSHFAVFNVWHRKQENGRRAWRDDAVATTLVAIFWPVLGRRFDAIGKSGR